MPDSERQGLLAAGNFIIDHVKIIDAYPAPEMLCNIQSKTSSNGGGPYNVLKNLAKMGAAFPLQGLGLLGNDADGAWIRRDCETHGIDASRLVRMPDTDTSYTDAMTVASTGQRTFFHHRGANAILSPAHVDFKAVTVEWFYLGYLLLLDTLDHIDPETERTGASVVLERAKQAGLKTVVDLVSVPDPNAESIIRAALPHIDVLFLNEIECGMVLGETFPEGTFIEWARLEAAARSILELGVQQLVVVHCRQGAVAVSADGAVARQAAVQVPSAYIVGSTGAGDAFAAGVFYGLKASWDLQACLELGVCAAAVSLGAGPPSEAMRPVDACLEQGRAWGFES